MQHSLNNYTKQSDYAIQHTKDMGKLLSESHLDAVDAFACAEPVPSALMIRRCLA
jgi:hypothetical protein